MSFDETNYCLNMNANMSINSCCWCLLFVVCCCFVGFFVFCLLLFFVCFFGEFDPGSGRTLAACLTHASRTERPPPFLVGVLEWRTGE